MDYRYRNFKESIYENQCKKQQQQQIKKIKRNQFIFENINHVFIYVYVCMYVFICIKVKAFSKTALAQGCT